MGARDLLADAAGAGLTIAADGDRLVIRPASMLTQAMREALRLAKPELLTLLREAQPGPVDLDAVAWSDSDIKRFLDRRARLLRWGWAEPEAEALAEKLVIRDREADDRVSCADCRHYRPGRCGNHRRAGLQAPDLGHTMAALLQRCPGFEQ
jgi:hypothetical protein